MDFKKRGKLISCSCYTLLPPLEVELHDGEAEQESKEDGERHDHRGHHAQPAVLEAEVLLHEDIHGDAVVHGRRNVPELRHDQPVQRPCHRARPTVPLPPDWDFLNILPAEKQGSEFYNYRQN